MEMAGTGPPLGIVGHSLGSTDDQIDTPAQVANKYNVGDIIGDGTEKIICYFIIVIITILILDIILYRAEPLLATSPCNLS